MLTEAPALDLGAIPAELTAERAWCVWSYEDRDGKQTKDVLHFFVGQHAGS